jgi:hypothetical protein
MLSRASGIGLPSKIAPSRSSTAAAAPAPAAKQRIYVITVTAPGSDPSQPTDGDLPVETPVAANGAVPLDVPTPIETALSPERGNAVPEGDKDEEKAVPTHVASALATANPADTPPAANGAAALASPPSHRGALSTARDREDSKSQETFPVSNPASPTAGALPAVVTDNPLPSTVPPQDDTSPEGGDKTKRSGAQTNRETDLNVASLRQLDDGGLSRRNAICVAGMVAGVVVTALLLLGSHYGNWFQKD